MLAAAHVRNGVDSTATAGRCGEVVELLATLAIGALAGLYTAVRASRLPPTEALSGT